jgi:hypothetical protein
MMLNKLKKYMKNTINKTVALFLLLSITSFSFGQLKDKLPEIKTEMKVRKSGPYFGIQKGMYTLFEAGGEFQWKKVKLIKPIKNAVHAGMNYNFKYNVLGFDAGYWFKNGRINFTYGANLNYRTDVTHSQVGFSPVIGYKLTQLHLQVGYHFLTPTPAPIHTNTLFISLRFVLINHRNVDFD